MGQVGEQFSVPRRILPFPCLRKCLDMTGFREPSAGNNALESHGVQSMAADAGPTTE
jgi:hypothetical protein